MNSKNTLPTSEARKNIFSITKNVQIPSTYYTLTENGKPKAVILSIKEFESWQETLEVLKDFPNLKKDIADAHKDIKKGKTISLQTFFKKQAHVVPRHLTKKSSKRS